MKVCLLNESFPPVIDGVVNVLMNYADYMMRDFDAKIEVGTPEYPDGNYDSYPYPVVAYPSFNTAAQTNGYRTGNPLVGKAVSKLADFQPDIIHSHGPASATVVARLVREMTGAPIIYTYHTKYDIDIKRAMKIDLIADETIKAMVGNIEACDDIWVVSDGAGKSLKALGFQGDYRVMNNGVDFAKGRVDKETVAKATAGYDLPEGVPCFLYVGRLINYKNLPMILDALKILADSGQDFRMVFVGKGPDREELEKRAAELGLMGEGAGKASGLNGQGVGIAAQKGRRGEPELGVPALGPGVAEVDVDALTLAGGKHGAQELCVRVDEAHVLNAAPVDLLHGEDHRVRHLLHGDVQGFGDRLGGVGRKAALAAAELHIQPLVAGKALQPPAAQGFRFFYQ